MPRPGAVRHFALAWHNRPSHADGDEHCPRVWPASLSLYVLARHARRFSEVSEPGSPGGQGHPDRDGLSPARRLPGLIAANVSLIVAVMVYMGWAYDNSLYGYFHLSPGELGFGVQDYLLAALSLFKPAIMIAAVALIAAVVAATRGGSLARAAMLLIRKASGRVRAVPELRWLNDVILHDLVTRLPSPPRIPGGVIRRLRDPRVILAILGALLTITALALALIAQYAPVSTYLLLGLLAAGPLMLTRALRRNRTEIFPYTLAIVVAAACGLWAASLYASGLGTRAARDAATHLAARTAVAVYSAQPLALSGPGVIVQKLPPGLLYRYRYEGLRLLYMDSGTYYLLPAGWIPQLDLTYILDASDQTMFELYSGAQRTSYGT